MSYINEALKKAQKDKDTGYIKYRGVLAASGKGKGTFGNKAVYCSLLILLLILLVFISYSWLDFSSERTPEITDYKAQQQVSQHANPIDAKTLYDDAGDLYKIGRLHDAKRLYQEALGLDPGYIDALNNVGVIYIHEKDYLSAKRCFEKAIRLKPEYVEPYYNLACLYAIKDEINQGLVYLKKAVSLDQSVRDWARNDTDLQGLRVLSEFEEITGSGNQEKME